MIINSLLLLNAAATVIASSGGVYDINLSEAYGYDPSQGNQYYDEVYLTQVSFGTPAQTFTLIPDTGSPDTWVQGSNLGSPSFNPGASSTFVNTTKPWEFQYGGPTKEFFSDAAGYAARDTVAVGSGGRSLSLTDETFAVAQEANGEPFGGSQGILGLTHDPHVSSYNAPVYVQQAISRGLLREHRFGVRITRAQDANPPPGTSGGTYHRSSAGKITLGGVDTSQFTGPITYAPVQTHKGFWQVAIDGIYVNNKLVKSTKNYSAILDTGTSILITTPAQAVELFGLLGGTETASLGEYTVPCSTNINFKVKIGGTFLPIKAQDLNAGYYNSKDEDCYFKLLGVNATNANKNGRYPSKAPDIIVLGVPLLLNTYTIFDYSHGSRMGFATLKENGDLPTIAPLDVAQNTTARRRDVRV